MGQPIISSQSGEPLGVHLTVKGILADSATGLKASDIAVGKNGRKYKFFYIKIDGTSGGAGTMTIVNTDGETIDDVPYRVTDEWYPEPIQEITVDGTNTVTGITYGVSA